MAVAPTARLQPMTVTPMPNCKQLFTDSLASCDDLACMTGTVLPSARWPQAAGMLVVLARLPLLLLATTCELVPGAASVLLGAQLVLLEVSHKRCSSWSLMRWQDVVVVG